MVVYHGTDYSAWRNIFGHEIQTASKYNSPYANEIEFKRTEYGDVYLTDSWIAALEYASWANSAREGQNLCTPQMLVVIQIDIDETKLEYDPTDMKNRPMTDKKANFYRINKAIPYNEIKCVAGFKYMNFQDCCKDVDKWLEKREEGENIDVCIKWCMPKTFMSTDIEWNHDVF